MNVLENFLAGRQARREQDASDQQNAMQGFLQQNGQAIFSGDGNALGQLAGMGPEGLQSAFSIRGQQQQDQRATRQDQRADVEASRDEWRYQKEVEQYAAGISAQDAAAKAAQMENSIKVALAAETPEQFDQLMTQMGQPDLVGQFENREELAAQHMTMAEILKQRAGSEINPNDRFKVVGSQLVDLSADGGPSAVLTAPGQTETVYGPDGKPILTRGPAATGRPLTEGQSKDVGFATRARAALTTLDPIADSMTSRSDIVLDSRLIPLGLGREFQSDNFKVAKNAGQNFLLAILRKDTGAAVTPSEEEMYGDIFLPKPGDGKALLQQKAQARELAISGLEQGMTADAILAKGRAITQATGVVPDAPTAGAAGSGSPTFDPAQLSPEAAAVWQKYSTPATP